MIKNESLMHTYMYVQKFNSIRIIKIGIFFQKSNVIFEIRKKPQFAM